MKQRRRQMLNRWIAPVAGILVIAALLYPRLARCYVYHKIVTAGDSAANLARSPRDIVIVRPDAAMSLSLGYAETAFPSGWITQITTHFETTVLVNGTGGEVIFWPPAYESNHSADGNYSWRLATTRAMRRPVAEVFAMSRGQFDHLLYKTLPKTADVYNQNGIAHFETDNVRGIIRLGPQGKPGDVNVEVWSKRGRISQGIGVRCHTAEAAGDLVHCILAAMKYSVDEVPDHESLRDVVLNALHDHDVFSFEPD